MKKLILSMILLLCALLVGCAAQSIEEIKTQENIGETVAVRGTVSSSVKIGSFSGYIIADDSGETIGVSSSRVPEEGEKITVRGTLMRDTIFGYYIKE